MIKTFAAALAVTLLAGSADAVTIITYEAPGATATTVVGSFGVETFSAAAIGTHPLATTFGGSPYAGTFSSANYLAANQYGGAGGTGVFAQAPRTTTLTISGAPLDYFGLFASALDGINRVTFSLGAAVVDTIDLTAYATTLPNTYRGNPSVAFKNKDFREKFAFFNFNVLGGYDKVSFVRGSGGGFEFDNVTVGDVGIVPEPGVWALMIAGFGLVGFGMRRRNRTVVYA